MKELTGTARALEALGEALRKADSDLYLANARAENLDKEVKELREQRAKLTEALQAAERDRDDACKYALVLEKRLEAIIEEYRQPRPSCETRSKKEEGAEC